MKKFFVILFAVLLCGCTPQNTPEHSETRFLMDTVCTIRAGGENAEYAVIAAFDRIKEISDITDYYSETSETSKINNASENEEISLSDDMTNILSAALDVCESSEGAFDITISPLKDLWNISEGSHPPPSDSDIQNALQDVDYKQLILNKDAKTLTKTTSQCKIDLGGVTKGYAADCAAEVLSQNGCEYALIDLGGNVYAYGKNPKRNDGKWIIGIQTPFKETGSFSQTVSLSQGAVVTAGCYQRYFEWDNKLYHHIIDPKTGYPSTQNILGASIKTDTALYADCLSTACMVLGEEKGKELAKKYNAELFIEK